MVTWERMYISEIIKKKCDKDIYIYGAGKVGHLIKCLCDSNGIKISGFLVTELDVNVERKDGLPVLQFDMCKNLWNDILVLIGVYERGEHRVEELLSSTGTINYISTPEEVLSYDVWMVEKKKRPVLEVTPKIGCSVMCRYCPQKVLIRNYFAENKSRKSKMTMDDYKACLSNMPDNTLIEFAGFAEPFLHPQAVDMMEYAVNTGHEITLFTTLVGMSFEILNRITAMPIKQVVLHTADKDGYANIPVTKEYLDLLRCVVEAKKSDGSAFIDEANCQSSPHPAVLDVTKGRLKIYCAMSDRAGNLAESTENAFEHFNHQGRIYCDRADNLDHFVLLPDGTVVLCCNDFGMKHVMGNLVTNSYQEIMHSESMRQLKRAMNMDETQKCLCRSCVFAKRR